MRTKHRPTDQPAESAGVRSTRKLAKRRARDKRVGAQQLAAPSTRRWRRAAR